MCLESKVRKMEEIRYTEIDGKRFDVRKCDECPFRDMGDAGYAAHCTYPTLERDSENTLWIENDGVPIQEGCPLREVKERKPCPFCGSTDLKEVYYDDEGDMLEEWMMEEANNDGCDYKSWQEYLDARGYVFCIDCMNCHGCVQTKVSIEDAWAKWNKRV